MTPETSVRLPSESAIESWFLKKQESRRSRPPAPPALSGAIIGAMLRHLHCLLLAQAAVWGLLVLQGPVVTGQQKRDEPVAPGWCRQLPRPGYAALARILPDDPWFEVYRIRPGVFAIYEPRQWEEVISFLIVGDRRALLFDTGIGVGPAHNLPVAQPKYLLQQRDAFSDMRARRVEPVLADGYLDAAAERLKNAPAPLRKSTGR
jgi:hypothetical protein